jgi:hypothetical protein
MMDMSALEMKYFVSEDTYNCPFCHKNNIVFRVIAVVPFNGRNKKVFAIFVKCSGCNNVSMHLSETPVVRMYEHDVIACMISIVNETLERFGSTIRYSNDTISINRKMEEERSEIFLSKHNSSCPLYFEKGVDIDDAIFYHMPSSDFSCRPDIPEKLRELLEEANTCLKANALTGASACIRKAIYEFLAKHELKSKDYKEQIKELKKQYPTIDSQYFDILNDVQGITSIQLHEGECEKYDARCVKLYLKVLQQVFFEVYILPKRLKADNQEISRLHKEIKEIKSDKDKAKKNFVQGNQQPITDN